MEVLRLSAADHRLLATRFDAHGNSHLRLVDALEQAGAEALLERAHALRGMECRFDIDLGSLCHRFEHRADAATHPIERMVMEFVAEWHGQGPQRDLWVLLDRVQQVRDLMTEGHTSGSGSPKGWP